MRVRVMQYLKEVRQLDGYGEVCLPHCACDARKGGHVVPAVGYNSFRLKACKDDGTMEVSHESRYFADVVAIFVAITLLAINVLSDSPNAFSITYPRILQFVEFF